MAEWEIYEVEDFLETCGKYGFYVATKDYRPTAIRDIFEGYGETYQADTFEGLRNIINRELVDILEDKVKQRDQEIVHLQDNEKQMKAIIRQKDQLIFDLQERLKKEGLK